MIEIDELGANWELAQVHAKTTAAGRAPGGGNEVERCPCCFRKIVTQSIGLFQNSKELEVLGFAYPLYFKFLKYSMILILFEIGSYNIPLLFSSIPFNDQQCSDQSTRATLGYMCESFLVRIANVIDNVTASETVSRVCSFFIQLFLLIYIRHKMTNTLKYYGQRRTVISNYSILIKDLPELLEIKQKIKRLFSQFFSSSHFTQEIILISFLSEYYDLKDKKNKVLKQKIKLMGQSYVDEDLIKANDLQITKVQILIDNQVQKTIFLTKKDQLLCQKVIVIVQTEESKQNVLPQFEALSRKQEKIEQLRNIFGCKDVSRIRIQSAPEPQQIIWQHMNTPRKKRRIKQILGWVFTTLFMCVLSLIFYFILKQKSELVTHYLFLIEESSQDGHGSDANSYKIRAEALVYIYIALIVLLNKFVISKFLHFVSVFQRPPTYSKEEYFFSLKYTITLFLTTAVLTIIVQDFTFQNIYHQKYGIVEEESFMFIVSSFVVPLLWLINPLQIYRTIKRKKVYGSQKLTQREANQLMMDEPASLGKLFAETIETIWFTYMYSSIIPAGGILVLVGFAINYWVVKFNILRRSSIDHQVSGKFIMMALNLLDISLVMKPVGQILFDTQIRGGFTIQSIVCASIGLAYCLLPTQWILQQVHKQDFLLSEKTYEEVKHNFTTSYQMSHPIYSLKKIYVEKELESFKLYELKGQTEERRPTKKLPISIELALMRRSSQFKLQSRLSQTENPQLYDNSQALHVQNKIVDVVEQETSGY